MAIDVVCACGKTLRAADEYAGKKVRCRVCGGTVTIPIAGLGITVDDDDIPLKSPKTPAPISFDGDVGKAAKRLQAASTPFELAVLEKMDKSLDHLADMRKRVYGIWFVAMLPFFFLAFVVLFYLMMFLLMFLVDGRIGSMNHLFLNAGLAVLFASGVMGLWFFREKLKRAYFAPDGDDD